MKALLQDSEVEAGRRRVVIIVHAAGRNMVRSLTQGKVYVNIRFSEPLFHKLTHFLATRKRKYSTSKSETFVKIDKQARDTLVLSVLDSTSPFFKCVSSVRTLEVVVLGLIEQCKTLLNHVDLDLLSSC
jgi:hypothetical protein